MFVRRKKVRSTIYLQLVENRWEGGRARQRVVATLGRLDELQASGNLERLLASAARASEEAMVVSAHEAGRLENVTMRRIGPALVFERLWQETGCRDAVMRLLQGRQFAFPVERAVFSTVLHRLFDPGSDRAGRKWVQDYAVDGVDDLELHHMYRAMAWLGEPLAEEDQEDRTPFAPRCVKDLIEEDLFAQRRDLFSSFELVFFDTTSIYFEGRGGSTLGRRGHSKDHRPDLTQMIVGAVLDATGRPVCCEMWPGNTTDVRTLLPVVDRLRARFHVGNVCIVADRGMISAETIAGLEARGLHYILGARSHSTTEVREDVLRRAGRYKVVHPERSTAKDPSPLKVKEVWVEDRRYVVCVNEEQRAKDAADREAIVSALREQLRRGPKALVGNKGYRRYLDARGAEMRIDEDRVAGEARFDGKWVLRTNSELPADEVATQYKNLWMVEALFRTTKSLLETRPIFHQRDETIRGHVFCSFLALVLAHELQTRLRAAGEKLEWADVIGDLERLQVTHVEQHGKRFAIRSNLTGCCGKVLRAAGVAPPPTTRRL